MLQNQIESLNEQPGTSQSPKGIDVDGLGDISTFRKRFIKD